MSLIRGTIFNKTYNCIQYSRRQLTDFVFQPDASYNFDQRIIGITGAYGGFGTILASRIVKNGGTVVAFGRDEEKLETLRQECESIRSSSIHCVISDLSSPKGQNEIIEGLKSYKADSLINNAGTAVEAELLSDELNRANYEKVMNVNLTAPLFITNSICSHWVENDIPGTILNISSFASLSTIRGHLIYSISKSGLDILTKQIALELTSKNIKANSINATVVKSAMGTEGRGYWNDDYRKKWFIDRVPINRYLDVEEIGSIACYLLSKECPLVGQCIAVCGGMSNGATNIESEMILPKDYHELKQENEESKEKIRRLTAKVIGASSGKR